MINFIQLLWCSPFGHNYQLKDRWLSNKISDVTGLPRYDKDLIVCKWCKKEKLVNHGEPYAN